MEILVNIGELKTGDTVIHNGEKVTVGKNCVKYSDFMGRTFRGDSYKLGSVKIIKVLKGV